MVAGLKWLKWLKSKPCGMPVAVACLGQNLLLLRRLNYSARHEGTCRHVHGEAERQAHQSGGRDEGGVLAATLQIGHRLAVADAFGGAVAARLNALIQQPLRLLHRQGIQHNAVSDSRRTSLAGLQLDTCKLAYWLMQQMAGRMAKSSEMPAMQDHDTKHEGLYRSRQCQCRHDRVCIAG